MTKSSPIGYFICTNNSSVEVEAHRYSIYFHGVSSVLLVAFDIVLVSQNLQLFR